MRNVLTHGSDPSLPMDIDFMIACPDVAVAERIAPLIATRGYITKIAVDPDEEAVTCYCTRNMLLDYDALIAVQSELDTIARRFEGYIDGWGTFGNFEVSGAKP